MSYVDKRKVKCSCGNIFESEIIVSVNVSTEPEMDDFIVDGRFNIVRCPKCNTVLYIEIPFFYIDPQEHLIIYIYPEEYYAEKEKYIKEAEMNFELALSMVENIKEEKKYFFKVLFGIEKLVEFIKWKELENDEISLVIQFLKKLNLRFIEFPPELAREKNIIKKLPVKKNIKHIELDTIIDGLQTIVNHLPGLKIYKSLLESLQSTTEYSEKVKQDIMYLLKHRIT